MPSARLQGLNCQQSFTEQRPTVGFTLHVQGQTGAVRALSPFARISVRVESSSVDHVLESQTWLSVKSKSVP